jgi:hypothetical protein
MERMGGGEKGRRKGRPGGGFRAWACMGMGMGMGMANAA